MDGLRIKKANAGDRRFAFETKRAAFKEYVEEVFGWDEEEQQKFHDQRFESQDFRIINFNGQDVGIMALDVQPDCVKFNQIFLLPDHQGKGIGKACMLEVIEEARLLALPIRLRVLKVNPRAHVFYKRLGFVCYGETKTHVLMQMVTR